MYLQVDEEVVSRASNAVSALKYSLLCEGDLFDRTLEKVTCLVN